MLEIIGKFNKIDFELFNQTTNHFFKTFDISSQTLIEIMFVNENAIKKYNLKYRQIDQITDVLSFPQSKLPGKKSILGTVVICDNEYKFGKKHIVGLINHGLLHLIGLDHENDHNKWSEAENKL